ncbi:GH1 family beta-glucosidase [Streptomyces sp. NPDC001904]|uniref:GH1 family beta-glucosidase n=1 Tax=Streptomyces sp. NPDC001904 TaxID=3154531 RepID=UPI003329AFEE
MAADPDPLPPFPPGFLWGVATSAHQIEGALDRRGPSVWDAFTAEPGRVRDGTTAETACDHVDRYREDVGLIRDLGVDAYRFSVSWPRVLSPGGLDFYDRLVDELCAQGIRPVPTLFHWDTPLEVEEAGGWLSRSTAERFAAYTATVAARLGDRVDRWITLNEPAEHTLLGHALGQHAPGHKLLFDALPVAHHQLLAHGLAARVLREAGATSIGIANSHGPTWPASADPADTEAAELYDILLNRLFSDPLILGRYPDGFAEAMPGGDVAGDLRTISEGTLDWYGVNYYQPTEVGAPGTADVAFSGLTLPAELPFSVREIKGYPRTDFDWPVVPDAFAELLTGLRERYGDRLPPLVVTENGCAYDGVDDRERVAFLDGHLRALHRAIGAGVDVRGYFVWSLMDNFEWAEGFTKRFGLVHVDYATQRRTPKTSYAWLRAQLRAQRG